MEDQMAILEEIAEKLGELNELAQKLDEDDDLRRHILSETQGSSRGWLGRGFMIDEVNARLEDL